MLFLGGPTIKMDFLAQSKNTFDFYSERNLMLNLKVTPVQIDECLMIDLKTGINIWDMNSSRQRSVECSSDLLIPILGQKPEFSI